MGADFLTLLMGISLALLFCRQFMLSVNSVIEQSSKNMFDLFDWIRNSVKLGISLISNSAATLSL